MADVLERDVEEHSNMAVPQRVIRHPPRSAHSHDTMSAKQSEGVRARRLAHPGGRRKVADAELATLQETHQQTKPARVREQAEHGAEFLHEVNVGQTGLDRRHPSGVDQTELTGIQARHI
jgi:hypothetical protein